MTRCAVEPGIVVYRTLNVEHIDTQGKHGVREERWSQSHRFTLNLCQAKERISPSHTCYLLPVLIAEGKCISE